MKILIVYILMSYDGITSFHQGELRDVENIFGQSQSYGRMSEIWRESKQFSSEIEGFSIHY